MLRHLLNLPLMIAALAGVLLGAGIRTFFTGPHDWWTLGGDLLVFTILYGWAAEIAARDNPD